MVNRVVTVKTTKAYAEAFNDRDVVAIANLLDDNNVIFSRQEQSTIVGKENVLRRIRNLFWRVNELHQNLEVVEAIVDLGETKARPCLLCYLNNVPVALCVLSCKINGKINAISILLSGGVVASARPTQKRTEQKTQKENEQNRRDVIAVTKLYVEKFNKRDLINLGELLDINDTVFTRTDQRAVVGRAAILDRVRDLYRRLDAHGQTLQVVNAIIDHDGHNAWPCTLGVLDGTPVSVGMLKVTGDQRIAHIDIIMTPSIVEKARATEPINEVKEAKPELAQLQEREDWLRERAAKIAKAIKRDGKLPHLITKQIRVEQELEKIEYLKRKYR